MLNTKILNVYKKFVENAYLLALLALVLSLPIFEYSGKIVLTFFIPAFLFTIANKRIAKFTEVLGFSFVFTVLWSSMNMAVVIFGAPMFPEVAFLQTLILTVFSFIAAIVIFYITNLTFFRLFKFLNVFKSTGKVVSFLDYLFLKAPYILFIAALLCVTTVNVYENLTMEGGRFIYTGISKLFEESEYDSRAIPVADDKVLVLKHAYYEIFDTSIGKKIKEGTISGLKHNSKEFTLAMINPSEVLIIEQYDYGFQHNKENNFSFG